MALLQTPSLKSNIDSALKSYHDTMWNGKIIEGELYTDPAKRESIAREKLSNDIANAITEFIELTVFQVKLQTLATAGSPMAHMNVSPGIIEKL